MLRHFSHIVWKQKYVLGCSGYHRSSSLTKEDALPDRCDGLIWEKTGSQSVVCVIPPFAYQSSWSGWCLMSFYAASMGFPTDPVFISWSYFNIHFLYCFLVLNKLDILVWQAACWQFHVTLTRFLHLYHSRCLTLYLYKPFQQSQYQYQYRYLRLNQKYYQLIILKYHHHLRSSANETPSLPPATRRWYVRCEVEHNCAEKFSCRGSQNRKICYHNQSWNQVTTVLCTCKQY